MPDDISTLLNVNQFIPHGLCFRWDPYLLWTLVISDGLIALSYYSIPLALILAVGKRTNDRIKWIILMFSAFIFACGTTHLVHIITIWYPNYWLDAGVKVATAIISAATAIALWPIARHARAYVEVQQKEAEDLSVTNSRLRRTLSGIEQERKDLERLNKLSGILHVCNTFDEIGRAATDTLQHVFPHSSGALYLAEPNESEFALLASWGDYEPQPLVEPWKCWSFRLGHVFPDEKVITSFSCDASNCGIQSGRFCLPVTGVGKILALLQFQGINYYTDSRDYSLLSIISERLGLAIYNLRLKNSLEFNSTRDELTGLFNRRYLDETLHMEGVRAGRDGTTFSIVMFDLDNFKKLNDKWGHEAGDHALKLFAKVLQSNLRGGDVACRYGGEEFVLILPGSSLDNAEETANRVRMSLEATARESDTPEFTNLTVSAGVANFPQSSSASAELLHLADQALYVAKNAGRNRVIRSVTA